MRVGQNASLQDTPADTISMSARAFVHTQTTIHLKLDCFSIDFFYVTTVLRSCTVYSGVVMKNNVGRLEDADIRRCKSLNQSGLDSCDNLAMLLAEERKVLAVPCGYAILTSAFGCISHT